jgi:PAS domain S-box-containing protein
MDNSGSSDILRLKKRIITIFGLVAVLLVAGAMAYHARYRASMRAGAEQLLLSTAQIKLDQLKHWRADRLDDTMSLLDSPVLGLHLRRFAADRTDKETAGLLRARLRAYLRHNPYPFAAIADEKGKVLLSAGSKPEITCTQFHALIPKALRSGRPEMGDFYLPEGDNSPHIDIVAPALPGSKAAGLLLLLRVDPEDFLYPLLQTWSASGETGEILLVTRSGEDVLFLNDLRHVPGAALRLRRPITEKELPAARALRGHSGIVKGPDYRGVEVLAAVGPVSGTTWGLVTKLDWDEVMAGTDRVGLLLVLVVLSLLASVGAGTFVLFHRQEEKAREMLARLTDQVPGVVYQYRLYPDGRSCFPYSSTGMYQIYGVTSEEVREDATPVFGRLHPDDLKSTSEAIFESARNLSVFHWEFRVVLPEQGLRWRLCDARPERLPDGGTLWHGVIIDITERKRAEQKILKLNRGLEEKNREMENFLYITTHDLRTPLVNIQGFSQNVRNYFQEIGKLLGEGAGGEERIKVLTDKKIPEALAFVQEGSEKMEALIAALLKVSRAGRVELKPEKTELEPLLRKIMDAMRFQMEAAGGEVAVSPGLPPCFADPGAVSQIFSNLLDNALKYRDPARPLRVRITAEKKDSFAVYSVADNGRGISGRELKNIWVVFARPISARERGEGIGLPMVKRIAERSGGVITAESKEGGGSVFRVELPAA